WLVLGDSYATNPGNGRGGETVEGGMPHRSGADKTGIGYPQGSLLGIPAQVMLAASADGWVVRNDVVWAKAACMPESVKGWAWQQVRGACITPRRVVNGSQKEATVGHRETRHGGFGVNPATVSDPVCPHCGGS